MKVFVIFMVLLALDLYVIDPVPFVDEILLAIGSFMSYRSCKSSRLGSSQQSHKLEEVGPR